MAFIQLGQIEGAAPISSPALTGTPTGPTPAQSETDGSRLATVDFVRSAVAAGSSGSDINFSEDILPDDTPNITFAANVRTYAQMNITGPLLLELEVLNTTDNYLLLYNMSGGDVDVNISTLINYGGNTPTTVLLPDGGIIIPAGCYMELSIYASDTVAVIKASSALAAVAI